MQIRINGRVFDYTDRFGILATDAVQLINIFRLRDSSGTMKSTNPRMPADGSFPYKFRRVNYSCRMSVVPIKNGFNDDWQKLDIRLISQKNELVNLDDLYFGADLDNLRRVLFSSSSGMFLNSGPVGTGKTTSLYAQIKELQKNSREKGERIVVYSIEDPVEIVDETFVQSQVRRTEDIANDLSPALLLKQALRSDPDVILYGEIRDSEAAKTAMQASQTGLKMFSTLHASDCVRSINRLLDLDVPKMSLLSELRIILCQRLVGVLCPHCSKRHELTDMERAVLTDAERRSLEKAELRERGSAAAVAACTNDDCNNGIIGRIAICEYVIFNDEIRNTIYQTHDFTTVGEVLKKNNFISMRDKGVELAARGIVELDEVVHRIGFDAE